MRPLSLRTASWRTSSSLYVSGGHENNAITARRGSRAPQFENSVCMRTVYAQHTHYVFFHRAPYRNGLPTVLPVALSRLATLRVRGSTTARAALSRQKPLKQAVERVPSRRPPHQVMSGVRCSQALSRTWSRTKLATSPREMVPP